MENNRKYRIRGIIGTVLFHVIIFLILLFLGFTTPLPLPGEEGVEVSLGTASTGFGDFQPEKPVSVQETTPPPKAKEQFEEEVVTQDTEETPAIETSKEPVIEEKSIEEVEEKEEIKEEPIVNPAALYKGKSNTARESASEGNTEGEGDMGAEGGSIDSKSYLGKGGFGEGTSYDLGGRKHRRLVKPKTQFSENATVVVQIYVNKAGKVIKAVAIDRGSTTTSTKLRKLAEEAARNSIFQAKPDAAEVQRGTITYHFILKN